jgi:hypothetical protein
MFVEPGPMARCTPRHDLNRPATDQRIGKVTAETVAHPGHGLPAPVRTEPCWQVPVLPGARHPGPCRTTSSTTPSSWGSTEQEHMSLIIPLRSRSDGVACRVVITKSDQSHRNLAPLTYLGRVTSD